MENYKIRIPNADISRQVQEKAFRLGWHWNGNNKNIFFDASEIYLYSDLSFTRRISRYNSEDRSYFDLHRNQEISYQDFLALPEFDINNCKINISRLAFHLLLQLKAYLEGKNITSYGGARNVIRLMWSDEFNESQQFNPLPYGILIRNGKTIMIGTELYFNQLPEKEVTVEQIMQLKTNKTTQIEEKIMGEITLNCIKEPQNAKNITVGRGYTGILINSDDTQVDTWDEASHFLCTNNKGTEAKYKLSLFERVAPPELTKLTMDQLIAALEVDASRVVIECNDNEIDVVNRGYENSLSESSSGCSCGIRSIDELGSLYERLSNESYSHIEEIVEDFDEDVLIEKLFEKIVVAAIEDVSAAFVLMSTIEDDLEVCEIVDRVCETRNGWSTDYTLNPNSGNNIKAWLIPVNTES